MDDPVAPLVERLRKGGKLGTMREAADRIETLEHALAEARSKAIEECARACRLYPDWCANWGMDRNMKVATEAALECAGMLEKLPADLPTDDDAAAMVIYCATDEWKRQSALSTQAIDVEGG